MLRVETVPECNDTFPTDRLLALPTNRTATFVVVDLTKWGAVKLEVGATDEGAVAVLERVHLC